MIRGAARARLGEVFADALLRRQPDAPAAALEQERARPLRAPLLIAVAARIDPQHPKIPEIEQILSTAAAAQNILIAAHAQGFGAKWLTGANAYDEHVKGALGLAPSDRLLGFIHLGSIRARRPPSRTPMRASTPWSGRAEPSEGSTRDAGPRLQDDRAGGLVRDQHRGRHTERDHPGRQDAARPALVSR